MISVGTVNTDALDRVIKKLSVVVDLRQKEAVAPLLADFYAVIVEDNRRGVMMGLDKNDKPAPPLKYRNAAKIQSGARSMKSGMFGIQEGARFKGMAPRAGKMLANNNLTTAQYRKMTGPRQAPRRDSSRIIANLRLRNSYLVNDKWVVEAGWNQYVNKKGKPILPWTFNGTKTMAAYPLDGVRAWGRRKALLIAKAYFLRLIKVYA